MTTETIVAVYDTAAHADAAVRDLEAANVPSGAISRHPDAATTGMSGGAEPVREKASGPACLAANPTMTTAVYDRSLSRCLGGDGEGAGPSMCSE